MRRRHFLNPSLLALVALLLILVGSVATSNGATSTSESPELSTADGIVNSPGSTQGSAGPQGATGPRGKRGPRGQRGKTGARGRTGARGPVGASGAMGPTGAAGAAGTPGAAGAAGATGPIGAQGLIGPTGIAGATGSTGPPGTPGIDGATGATGATGPISPQAFAQFFALMPPDNPTPVALGDAVEFPQDGPSDGAISRLSSDTFNLADIGTYRVAFSVPANEAGQLVLSVNGSEVAYTAVGRATGASSIAGETLITTTVVNSTLSVNNPASGIVALTITTNAGGNTPAAASLIIEQIR